MKGVVNLLKIAFRANKKIFVISLLIIVALVIVGCTTGQGGGSTPFRPDWGGMWLEVKNAAFP